jgi:hypothetical protein
MHDHEDQQEKVAVLETPIVGILKEGTRRCRGEMPRKRGISSATYYAWK